MPVYLFRIDPSVVSYSEDGAHFGGLTKEKLFNVDENKTHPMLSYSLYS